MTTTKTKTWRTTNTTTKQRATHQESRWFYRFLSGEDKETKTKTKDKAKDKDIDNNEDKDMGKEEYSNKKMDNPSEEQVGL